MQEKKKTHTRKWLLKTQKQRDKDRPENGELLWLTLRNHSVTGLQGQGRCVDAFISCNIQQGLRCRYIYIGYICVTHMLTSVYIKHKIAC